MLFLIRILRIIAIGKKSNFWDENVYHSYNKCIPCSFILNVFYISNCSSVVGTKAQDYTDVIDTTETTNKVHFSRVQTKKLNQNSGNANRISFRKSTFTRINKTVCAGSCIQGVCIYKNRGTFAVRIIK